MEYDEIMLDYFCSEIAPMVMSINKYGYNFKYVFLDEKEQAFHTIENEDTGEIVCFSSDIERLYLRLDGILQFLASTH